MGAGPLHACCCRGGFYNHVLFPFKHKEESVVIALSRCAWECFAAHESVMKKVFAAGFPWEIAVTSGVLTAIGGGLIRDVLAGRTNLLLSSELYATPILVGALLYVLLMQFIPDSSVLQVSIIIFVFLFRVAAIRF